MDKKNNKTVRLGVVVYDYKPSPLEAWQENENCKANLNNKASLGYMVRT